MLLAPEATPDPDFLPLPGLGLLTRGKGGLELGSPPSEVLAPAPLSLLQTTSSRKGLRQVLRGHKVFLSANVKTLIQNVSPKPSLYATKPDCSCTGTVLSVESQTLGHVTTAYHVKKSHGKLSLFRISEA